MLAVFSHTLSFLFSLSGGGSKDFLPTFMQSASGSGMPMNRDSGGFSGARGRRHPPKATKVIQLPDEAVRFFLYAVE